MKKQRFSCKRGELTIRGTEYIPGGEKRPIAIVCHGFTANESNVKRYAEWFARKGYYTLTFDFCGGCLKGSSDGATTDMSVLTEIEDLRAVMDYAAALPETDEKNIVLAGASQGGMVAALTAARYPDEVKRLILIYPAFCIPDDARKGSMQIAKFDPANVPETFYCGKMKLGKRYALDVMDMDPYKEITGYRGPVLILHGMKDSIVPVSYGVRAYETYTAAKTGDAAIPSPSVQLVTIESADHGFKPQEDKIAFFAMTQFLKGRTEVLNVHVSLTGRTVTRTGFHTYHRSLPFKGFVTSPYFKGEIGDGFSDEQELKGKKTTTHCLADYVVTGTDFLGKPCQIHITNEKVGDEPWNPRIHTDSKVLSFLNTAEYAEILEMRPIGPIVHIYCAVPKEAIVKSEE